MLHNLIKMRTWTRLFLAVSFIFFGCVPMAMADRSYSYDKIDVEVKVNQDSTLDITETQTYNFVGEYHEAWRTIPIDKISAVTDISVYDGETGAPLSFVGGKRDKTLPVNWGKYTVTDDNGAVNIIWYYDQADTVHSWILKYKVHGAISFGKSGEDRLYWDIFDNYSVPVKSVEAKVALPGSSGKERPFAYRSVAGKNIEITQGTNLWHDRFIAENFDPKEAFTIDIGFPSGEVSRAAFWMGWLRLNYGYVGGVLIMLISFLVGLAYWYSSEGSKIGRGTIIPQYAPPENLHPAMAEVIVKETVTDKGLAATIIDLAVRGYVKIEEDPSKLQWLRARVKAPQKIILAVFFSLIILSVLTVAFDEVRFFIALPFIFIILLVLTLIGTADYTVTAIKDYKKAEELEQYEKKYLELLLIFDGKFSTKKLRNSSNQTKKDFKELLDDFKESLYRETELDTGAYERGVSLEKDGKTIFKIVFFILVGLMYLFDEAGMNLFANQMFDLAGSFILSVTCLFAYMKYEARLNEKGRILREDWLGFKMYLEVAERYRMQNLTPELFEKYLPYAIIFGVEKKWAKAFEAMAIAAPAWFYGNSHYSSSSTNFSPSSFSSSFSASFSSAFSSSGASGGAGGGGAGGGGGGGGGGAS